MDKLLFQSQISLNWIVIKVYAHDNMRSEEGGRLEVTLHRGAAAAVGMDSTIGFIK